MKTKPSKKIHGWIALILWAVLIISGIVAKRVYGHPDWMVLFHLPAAVMLVMSFGILSRDIRKKYQQQLLEMTRARLKARPSKNSDQG